MSIQQSFPFRAMYSLGLRRDTLKPVGTFGSRGGIGSGRQECFHAPLRVTPKDSYGFAGRSLVFFTALSCSSWSESTPWAASCSSLALSVIREAREAMESSKMTDEDRLMSEDEDSLMRFRCGGSTCCWSSESTGSLNTVSSSSNECFIVGIRLCLCLEYPSRARRFIHFTMQFMRNKIKYYGKILKLQSLA
jgi:hypothetical protein